MQSQDRALHSSPSRGKRQTTQNTAKQNYLGLVAFYNTRPGNETGLFYNAPQSWAHMGLQPAVV